MFAYLYFLQDRRNFSSSYLQATPISFSNGKLLPDRSTWIGNDNTPVTIDQRQYVNIISPDVPTKFAGRSRIDTGTNQYINFDATSAEKDVRSVRRLNVATERLSCAVSLAKPKYNYLMNAQAYQLPFTCAQVAPGEL